MSNKLPRIRGEEVFGTMMLKILCKMGTRRDQYHSHTSLSVALTGRKTNVGYINLELRKLESRGLIIRSGPRCHGFKLACQIELLDPKILAELS